MSFRRSNMSNAIELLMCTTPISLSDCFESDFCLMSPLMVSHNKRAFPRGNTNSLHASLILKGTETSYMTKTKINRNIFIYARITS